MTKVMYREIGCKTACYFGKYVNNYCKAFHYYLYFSAFWGYEHLL